MNRKYNPDYHNNIIRNYRAEAKEVGVDTAYLTDEELFALVNYWTPLSSSEEELTAILDDMRKQVKR